MTNDSYRTLRRFERFFINNGMSSPFNRNEYAETVKDYSDPNEGVVRKIATQILYPNERRIETIYHPLEISDLVENT